MSLCQGFLPLFVGKAARGRHCSSPLPTPALLTDSKGSCDTELAVRVPRGMCERQVTPGMCKANTSIFCLMEKAHLWPRCKAGYIGCSQRSRNRRSCDSHAKKKMGQTSSTELLVAGRKRNITKKKREKFAWRSEAVNKLCEECYRVSQKLLSGSNFYLYICSRRKLLQEGKICSSCKIHWDQSNETESKLAGKKLENGQIRSISHRKLSLQCSGGTLVRSQKQYILLNFVALLYKSYFRDENTAQV